MITLGIAVFAVVWRLTYLHVESIIGTEARIDAIINFKDYQ